jgi:hypothetical protein
VKLGLSSPPINRRSERPACENLLFNSGFSRFGIASGNDEAATLYYLKQPREIYSLIRQFVGLFILLAADVLYFKRFEILQDAKRLLKQRFYIFTFYPVFSIELLSSLSM